jgi:hypothetical protein
MRGVGKFSEVEQLEVSERKCIPLVGWLEACHREEVDEIAGDVNVFFIFLVQFSVLYQEISFWSM